MTDVTDMDATGGPADEGSAEALDGDVLGEKPGDEQLPGINAFDDRIALNVEDPTVLEGDVGSRDSVVGRTWREEPEVGAGPTARHGFRLVDDLSGEPDFDDEEKELVAEVDDSVDTGPADPLSPEQEAMTIRDQ